MQDKRVTVVGGGIAGLTAAWELSRLGIGVDLVEKSPFLGGHAIQYCCKATDECQQCGACEVEKMLKQVNAAEDIAVHLGADITTVQRDAGFTLQLSKAPRYIDPARDRELAACYAQCPDKSALRRGYSVNNHPLYAIDPAKADGIRDWCRDNAPAGCIDWNAQPTSAALSSNAVILAAGFTPYDATPKATYGLGRFANVVTGLEFERNRRLKGAYLRPSDDQPPRKVAFIQCVGSRDEHIGHLWCSTVCCPYALRMASVMTHERPDTAVTVFYMDIQNTGKTFPAFYARCQADMTFVRNIPIDVYPLDNDRLRIRHMAEEEGRPHDEEFDLLVLSIGITPGADNGLLAELFATGQNEDGFIRSVDPLASAGTAAAGVFVAGTLHGPKSIAASMAHAGQAAAEAAHYLRRAQ